MVYLVVYQKFYDKAYCRIDSVYVNRDEAYDRLNKLVEYQSEHFDVRKFDTDKYLRMDTNEVLTILEYAM